MGVVPVQRTFARYILCPWQILYIGIVANFKTPKNDIIKRWSRKPCRNHMRIQAEKV
jgi:hypothetical protein